MKCPKCRSERISQERRIDGDAICMDCHHRGKSKEFLRETNFDRIAASPEALANAMVFETMPHVWRFRIGEMISVQSFSSTDEAKQAAVEYLQQAVDSM